MSWPGAIGVGTGSRLGSAFGREPGIVAGRLMADGSFLRP